MHLIVAGLVELRAFRYYLRRAEGLRQSFVEMDYQPSLNAPYSLGTRFCAVYEGCACCTGSNRCQDDTGDLSDPSTLYTSAGAGSKPLAPAPAVKHACHRVKGRSCTFAIKILCPAGVGPRYLKALYHEYTDATFQVPSTSSCM